MSSPTMTRLYLSEKELEMIAHLIRQAIMRIFEEPQKVEHFLLLGKGVKILSNEEDSYKEPGKIGTMMHNDIEKEKPEGEIEGESNETGTVLSEPLSEIDDLRAALIAIIEHIAGLFERLIRTYPDLRAEMSQELLALYEYAELMRQTWFGSLSNVQSEETKAEEGEGG